MRIDVLTLFPAMFKGPLTESILQRAQEERLIDLRLHDLRRYGLGKYHQVDDRPYGGGAGMVMRPDVLVRAIEAVSYELRAVSTKRNVPSGSKLPTSPSLRQDYGRQARLRGASKAQSSEPYRMYLSPRGKRLTQAMVERLAKREWLLLLCGHYEGIDQRVIDGGYVDAEVSIGDYILTGGELPAMVLIDAIARQIPGVLGKEESAVAESFSKEFRRKREYPHFTRPEEFRGMRVPEVLLSGHHAAIERWRRKQLR